MAANVESIFSVREKPWHGLGKIVMEAPTSADALHLAGLDWKVVQDVGTTGYAEKEKSQASDSFRRACFNWGIGRELYTAPFIWIPAAKTVILSKEEQNKDGKNKEKRYYCNDRFSVSSIGYSDDKEINALVIVNEKGQPVYELKAKAAGVTDNGKGKNIAGNGNKGKTAQNKVQKDAVQKEEAGKPKKNSAALSKDQMDSLQAELNRTGVSMETVQSRYKIQEPGNMGEELYSRVMSALKRTKSAAA